VSDELFNPDWASERQRHIDCASSDTQPAPTSPPVVRCAGQYGTIFRLNWAGGGAGPEGQGHASRSSTSAADRPSRSRPDGEYAGSEAGGGPSEEGGEGGPAGPNLYDLHGGAMPGPEFSIFVGACFVLFTAGCIC
jgi:hypothetical protein